MSYAKVAEDLNSTDLMMAVQRHTKETFLPLLTAAENHIQDRLKQKVHCSVLMHVTSVL